MDKNAIKKYAIWARKELVNTETYYLVIADENGIEVGKEEFQIDIAFATDDFGFF